MEAEGKPAEKVHDPNYLKGIFKQLFKSEIYKRNPLNAEIYFDFQQFDELVFGLNSYARSLRVRTCTACFVCVFGDGGIYVNIKYVTCTRVCAHMYAN